MTEIWRVGRGIKLTPPFPVLSHAEAMDRYGTDKPDTRLGMELVTVTDMFAGTTFRVVADALAKGNVVRGFVVKNATDLSRKDLDALEATAKAQGAGGLLRLSCSGGRLSGPAAKFLGEDVERRIIDGCGLEDGQLLLALVGEKQWTSQLLGRLRVSVGKTLDLADPETFAFLWVNAFPLYERDEDRDTLTPSHHFFSMPFQEDIDRLDSDPLSVRAHLYDLVCNGSELASGSIRIHNRELQERVMAVAGVSKEDAARRFGFLLDALEYGAPPHGGIAPGVDRILTLLAGGESIRDVIAFPKTQKASSLMDDAPSPVEPSQLDELHIAVRETPEDK